VAQLEPLDRVDERFVVGPPFARLTGRSAVMTSRWRSAATSGEVTPGTSLATLGGRVGQPPRASIAPYTLSAAAMRSRVPSL